MKRIIVRVFILDHSGLLQYPARHVNTETLHSDLRMSTASLCLRSWKRYLDADVAERSRTAWSADEWRHVPLDAGRWPGVVTSETWPAEALYTDAPLSHGLQWRRQPSVASSLAVPAGRLSPVDRRRVRGGEKRTHSRRQHSRILQY